MDKPTDDRLFVLHVVGVFILFVGFVALIGWWVVLNAR